LKKILAVGIVVVAIVVIVGGVYLWRSISASFAEVETTVRSFITALNNYDADASWALMSSNMQDFYGTKADFQSSILDGFNQSGWQASITGIPSKEITTRNGVSAARFVVTLRITETDFGSSDETDTFFLIKTGNQWKIDDWREGEWVWT